MAATITDVTAAISLSLARSNKTAVLSQLQAILQWMKNKTSIYALKDFSRIHDCKEVLELLQTLVQHPLIISFDDCYTVLMECVSCLPLPSSCDDTETQQAVTSVLTALKATITPPHSTATHEEPDTVISSLLSIISETSDQALNSPEQAASLLHNISKHCASLVWMTDTHQLIKKLFYAALKLHESNLLAFDGSSLLSEKFVKTLSFYLSSPDCRLESSVDLQVALYQLNQPCFEDKLFSVASNALHKGQVHGQKIIVDSQLSLVCARSPQLFHFAREFFKVLCAESHGSTAVQELTWSFTEQFRTAVQTLNRQHHIHSYYPTHLHSLVELLSKAPTPNGIVHVSSHINKHLSFRLDQRFDVWFTLVQYSHWRHAALQYLGGAQTTPTEHPLSAVTECQQKKLLKCYEWDWIKPSDNKS